MKTDKNGTKCLFAWYVADSSANFGEHVAASGTLSSAKDSITTTGSFVITVAQNQGASKTLSMTDGDGNCFVYNGTGGALVPATPANPKEAAYTVTMTVEYTGTETLTADQCKALFATALGTQSIKVTAGATGTNASRVRFDTSSGLYDDVGEKVVTFSNSTAKGWAFDQSGAQGANHKTAAIDVDVWYVSINGADGGTADSSFSATVNFTPEVFTPAP